MGQENVAYVGCYQIRRSYCDEDNQQWKRGYCADNEYRMLVCSNAHRRDGQPTSTEANHWVKGEYIQDSCYDSQTDQVRTMVSRY